MGFFHVFLNCTNGTKSSKASHISQSYLGFCQTSMMEFSCDHEHASIYGTSNYSE